MTIDEVIREHKEAIYVYDKWITNKDDIDKEYIEKHKQYVEWLEELKFIRKWKADVMEDFCKYDCSSIDEVRHNAYNKAIDDCVNLITSCCTCEDVSSFYYLVCGIEQLKEGEKNDKTK